MIYLAASVLSSSMIYVVFRIAKNYDCRLTPLITYNYLAATLLGLLLFQPFRESAIEDTINWMPFGIFLGVLFIAMFFLIGTSSQKAGITITTLANKLSLVFPVLFSLFYYNESITTLKYIGLAGAFVAIALTVYKKDLRKSNLLLIALPLTIFFGSGLVDTLVKFVQAEKITTTEASAYTTLVFFVAFLCGLVIQLISGKNQIRIHPPTLLLGILLGVVNFGSLYFIIMALNHTGLKSSLVFALNNMLVVAFTAVLGTILFKEKLNKINFAGIILAIISLYFLL
ncbi:EamA family transporter [Maribellus sediminis]|uniref:EamA family transporter n=1 Tax=Maribellus sediminis TaxID=2696285 RepID=UPI001431816D|nr:EamA family transporter [Maribellus sediminis]